MNWPRYETRVIDDFTRLLEGIALKIARQADENKKKYMIGSGFAIEFFQGKVSRNHHDVDFHPLRVDAEWWVSWFRSLGYKVVGKEHGKDGRVYEVLGDEGELLVDIWPLERPEELRKAKKVTYKGINIIIEDPHKVLKSKASHKRKLRPQDLHDFALMGRGPKLEK